ncbi:MAG TPA: hypothetical protein VF647_26455 [Longimicrobium sp.]|jgi:hypothetical protein
MPSDFPLFRSLLALCVFMVVVGMGGSWLTGHEASGRRTRATASKDSAPAGAARAPAIAVAQRDSGAGGLCRVDTAGIALPMTVHESSGVAAGGGVLWTHNDSGEPVLVAVGMDGLPRGSVRVTGAVVEDWEDVAEGPCPAGRCLYVGDIGDNQAKRARITVYRVPMPAPGDAATRPAEAFHATYPDGPHDAEALFVTGDGGVFVVTKGETGPIAVYRFPREMAAGAVSRLERVRELAPAQGKRSDRITGAAASAEGWVALRTLRSVSFYRAGNLASGAAAEPLRYDLAPLKEAQGEAVAFGEGGVVHLTSEGVKKKDPATLARLVCNLPR